MKNQNIVSDLEIDDNGMIPTLNQMGHMFVVPDPITQAFIDDAIHAQGKVLEIGAAFGVASLPVICKGKSIIVNDLDARHLDYILKHTPQCYLKKLHLLPGYFPRDINLNDNSLEVIFASRVLHFLPPEEFMGALKDIYHALISGGRFYFISTTPYIYVYREFIPIFESNRAQGKPWPGLLENLIDIAPHRAHQLPKFINLIDLPEGIKYLQEAGFRILRAEYIPFQADQHDVALDGREHIGIICEKP